MQETITVSGAWFSGLLQFLRLLSGLCNRCLCLQVAARGFCSSCKQQPVAVTQAYLPYSISWICCRKRSVAVWSRVSFLNCSLKIEDYPGNWICTVTGACCKLSVVRGTEIPEGQRVAIELHLLSLWFSDSLANAVSGFEFFFWVFFAVSWLDYIMIYELIQFV